MSRAELQAAVQIEARETQGLLRLLRRLQQEGGVRFEGTTRARRYFRVLRVGAQGAAVALSPEAQRDLSMVSGPLHTRSPVGYRREFLDDYRPGHTEYLSPALKARLAALGQTPAAAEPAGTYARQMLERFLLDLSWNSSRLEGNTYSLLDTQRLLTAGEAAQGRDLVETQMLLNHKAAIEYIVAEPMTASVDAHTVKTLHALLLENLLANRLDEGRLRSTPVHIGGSPYVPLANPQLIDECFRQLLHTAAEVKDPFEQSFFLLAQLPYLQPFLDGNKRTARLAANLPFVIANLVPLSFADVPRDLFLRANLAVYELNRVDVLRDVFAWAYERSVRRLGVVRSSLGEPDPFRLKYRTLLRDIVAAVVQASAPAGQVKQTLEALISERVPSAEKPRVLAMAEVELESLHEGNYARYGLRPSEYEAWLKSREA